MARQIGSIRRIAGRSKVVRRFRDTVLAVDSYAYDASRFLRKSGMANPRDLAAIEAQITMDYHRLEKGLTLPNPNPWFGRETVTRLVTNCLNYQRIAKSDKSTLSGALGALDAYEARFVDQPCDWWPDLAHHLAALSETCIVNDSARGGTEPLGGDAPDVAQWDFPDFVRSRSSVRNFAETSVDEQVIRDAVRVAQATPSVCNRQATRVRIYERGDYANQLLRTQNGNRGFGDTASHVLLVTSDLSAFVTAGERNQGFIDGGMFAMTLIYALHDQGVSSCCLNWSAPRRQDQRLREVARIPDNEVVIMMIAVGYPAAGAIVTVSPLRDFERVLLGSDAGTGHGES